MVLLYSEKSPQAFSLPKFNLPSVDGGNYTSESFSSAEVIVILFICNHCPYVVAIEERIIALHRYFNNRPVQLVAICSNDPTDYPDDAPKKLLERWKSKDYQFPYLIDSAQSVARSFGAVCTPDIFVFDSARKLAYRGEFDDSWKDASKVVKESLKQAILDLLNHKTPESHQRPSMGCSIKWKIA